MLNQRRRHLRLGGCHEVKMTIEDEDCKDYDDVNENANDYYENEDEMKMI